MQEATWIAVALATITTIKGIVDSIMARLSTKDKLRMDVKMAILTERVNNQSDLINNQAVELSKCNEQHGEAREEIKLLKRQLDHKIDELKAEVKEQTIQQDSKINKIQTSQESSKPNPNKTMRD